MPRKQRFQHRKDKQRKKRFATQHRKETQAKHPPIVNPSRFTPEITSEVISDCYNGTPALTLQVLHQSLELPSKVWSDQSQCDETMVICKLSSGDDTHCPVVTHTLTVMSNLSWTLHVHGRIVHQPVSLWNHFLVFWILAV